MINYFKMPVGYLIPWDRQHNTRRVSLYGGRKQPPAKNMQEAAHSNGGFSPELWEWAMHVAHETCTQTHWWPRHFSTPALLQNQSTFGF